MQSQNSSSFIALRTAGVRIDRGAVRRAVRAEVQSGSQRVRVDCRDWSQFDLLVLSTLLGAADECLESRVTLELVNLPVDVRAKIESLGLAARLRVSDGELCGES
jgi:anti-anti-sigma regulatory factor